MKTDDASQFRPGRVLVGCEHLGLFPEKEWPGCSECDAERAAARPLVCTAVDAKRGIVTFSSEPSPK